MKNILIYNSGGGLGDSIQLFPLILSLKNHFKDSRFCYLGAHENHYLNQLIQIQSLKKLEMVQMVTYGSIFILFHHQT